MQFIYKHYFNNLKQLLKIKAHYLITLSYYFMLAALGWVDLDLVLDLNKHIENSGGWYTGKDKGKY